MENKNYPAILGAIIGDTVGSIYEFHNIKTTEFELLDPEMNYTDDSVMTLALARWLTEADPQVLALSDDGPDELLISIMREFGSAHTCPMGGYGGGFYCWLNSDSPKPYNSWGNGAAMRTSAAGYAASSLEQALALARRGAEPTHNHPEGVKGAQATAGAIFMARMGASKEEIRNWVESTFGYNLHRTCDEVRPAYSFDESCWGTVPEALIAFMDSRDFESTLRLGVSLGGDSDTLCCIAGGVAAAFYKEIPAEIEQFVVNRLEMSLVRVLNRFCKKYGYRQVQTPSKNRADRVTPSQIVSLKPNEVFVFGSNLEGRHGGGAAATAHRCFGAIWGQGVGRQGQTYAIPTMHGGVDAISPYVDDFIYYAKCNPIEKFLVTRVGCGIAGFKDEEMAPLFEKAVDVENISLPQEWWRILAEE